MKKALITGITGQDGSYLAELLLSKGYQVHGIKRRSSSLNTARIDHIYEGPEPQAKNLILHYGDMTDSSGLSTVLSQVRPDEIYNLAAQSHVAVSFQQPEYTANADGLGALRLLEAIRQLKLETQCRFYQASTSELFGKVLESPQSEKTPFYPRSPYGVAKLFAHWMTINYREAYGLFACNGILFNHESPRRGETFVSRKITRGLSRIAYGLESCLYLGNLDARRDWGAAQEYVEMMWLMLQQDTAEDYVIATGRQHTVRDFISESLKCLKIEVTWQGQGAAEKAVVTRTGDSALALRPGQEIIAIEPRYFRRSEVDSLLGDANKARLQLGWEPRIGFRELVRDMIRSDVRETQLELRLKASHPL